MSLPTILIILTAFSLNGYLVKFCFPTLCTFWWIYHICFLLKKCFEEKLWWLVESRSSRSPELIDTIKLTFTRSCTVLNKWHRLIEFNIGSLQSSTTLWVVMGGRPSLCNAYRHRLILTLSSFNSSSSGSGIRPLKINDSLRLMDTKIEEVIQIIELTSNKFRSFVYSYYAEFRLKLLVNFWSLHDPLNFLRWNCSSWQGILKMLQLWFPIHQPANSVGIFIALE